MGEVNAEKIVDFHKYCELCEYSELSESNDPCFDCLCEPVNVYSHRPIKFKAKDSQKN